jgi:AcrR family transcriptional regulator
MTKSLARRKFDEEAVLDAAAHVFRRRGFGAATVREVAQAAGMLPGSLHYRYRSKEALLVGLMERALERLTTAVRGAVEAAPDPAGRLRLAMRAHLDALLSGDDDVYVLYFDWRSLPPAAAHTLQRHRSRYEILWDDLLQSFANSGSARVGLDLPLLRQFIVGSLNQVAQWRESTDPRTPAEIADSFWTCLSLGLIPDDKRQPSKKRPLPSR